jgi:hypothetical protein
MQVTPKAQNAPNRPANIIVPGIVEPSGFTPVQTMRQPLAAAMRN